MVCFGLVKDTKIDLSNLGSWAQNLLIQIDSKFNRFKVQLLEWKLNRKMAYTVVVIIVIWKKNDFLKVIWMLNCIIENK